MEDHGYSVVRALTGHGIGRKLHEDPAVPNYGRKHTGDVLRPGMTIAIEPMVNAGTHRVYVLDNDWTIVLGRRSDCARIMSIPSPSQRAGR